MSGARIQAAEKRVSDVFSDEFRFTIPRYQRPYAWTPEQAGELIDDLIVAADLSAAPPTDLGGLDPYFLGSVVLVKEEHRPHAEVVDGQQRLTTLAMLLSMLRSRVSGEFADALATRLFQKGDPLTNRLDEPRVQLRARDQDFYEKHILAEDAPSNVLSLATDSLTDSQRNLVLNARLFLERLSGLSQEQCEALSRYVVAGTYLVLVSTRDFESAYRIFTVLNERGLDLTHSDILKSEIIGQIPEPEQDIYTRRWETEEEDLGRDDFADLFAHIRMIYAKSKARESILREFRASVLSAVPDGQEFIDEVLVPLSDAYEVVTRSDYRAPTGADEVNELLSWLNLLDNRDWIPPAIRFLSRPGAGAERLKRFLTDLERLAASMFVRRVDITRRIERYGRVLTDIEAGADLHADTSALQLDAVERAGTIERLRGEIYTVTRIRAYVLLRLDSCLSSGGATYHHPIITVEHVLPQSPKEGSRWRDWFTDEEHELWVHRLANLVLLTQGKNSEASNYDFEEKKERYFKARTGVSPFAITTQVLREREWTPALLSKRQDELVSNLAELWRLN